MSSAEVENWNCNKLYGIICSYKFKLNIIALIFRGTIILVNHLKYFKALISIGNRTNGNLIKIYTMSDIWKFS